MHNGAIIAIGTSLPGHYYQQQVLSAALRKFCMAKRLNIEFDDITNIFNNAEINGRYFAFPIDSLYEPPDFPRSVNIAIEQTVKLCEAAVRALLEKVDVDTRDISLLALASLTPAGAPAIDARLMNRIPFSQYIKRMPLVGFGCMGGASALARVSDYLAGHPKELALLIAAETPSHLWQGSIQTDLVALSRRLKDDPSAYMEIISTIVSAALFADGAAAVLIAGREHPLAASTARPRIVDNQSNFTPDSEHIMGMVMFEGGYRNILTAAVPDYARRSLKRLIGTMLSRNSLGIEEIDRWIVHPGGPKVIQAIEAEFNLDSEDLQLSRNILLRVGNISSPTVLFMLDEIMSGRQPETDSYGLLVAMGSGFSQEAVLLKW